MLELYRVIDGDFTHYYWAKSEEDALNKYTKNHFSYRPKATKTLTDQGYPIVRLKDVPDNKAFHFVDRRGKEFWEFSGTWEKTTREFSDGKWCICKRIGGGCNDVATKGEEMVTIDTSF
jgi:hypothetical protein